MDHGCRRAGTTGADLNADVEHRLHERILWLTNILRGAAGMEQHQSDQINRLTPSR